MRFDQFHQHLASIAFKRPHLEVASSENFSYYLMCRYLSMLPDPNITTYINEVCNNNDLSMWLENEEEAFNYLEAIMPRLPWTKIEYIKKKSTEEFIKSGYSEEEVANVADYFEISKREARDLLTRCPKLINGE